MNPLYLATFALIFALVGVLCAIWALNLAARARDYASDCAKWMDKNNEKTKIVALEAEITEIVDSMSSIRESLHKMRSRIGMREYRDRKKAAEKAPQFDKTPEGRDAERAALEKELQDKGMLNARIHLAGGNRGN